MSGIIGNKETEEIQEEVLLVNEKKRMLGLMENMKSN